MNDLPQHWTCDKWSGGPCWVHNSMCILRLDIKAIGGRLTRISHLEVDGKEEDDAAGQETLPLVFLWIYV